LDTLALSPERQSVQMSEIKKCRLYLDGIYHFKCNCLTPLHCKGLIKISRPFVASTFKLSAGIRQ